MSIDIDRVMVEMRDAIDRIKEEQGAVAADFFRAHYQGCIKLVEMRKHYNTLPKGKEKTELFVEVTNLADSLNQTLPILKG